MGRRGWRQSFTAKPKEAVEAGPFGTLRQPFNPRALGCKCDVCPLKDQTPIPPEGPADAEFIMVGDAPNQIEIEKGAPIQGPTGQKLNELLRQLSAKLGRVVSRGQIYTHNTVMCRPKHPEREGKGAYDSKEFMAWLNKENQRRRAEARKEKRPANVIESPIECCKPALKAALEWYDRQARARGEANGAVIVPLGNFSLQAVTGLTLGISKMRGSVIEMHEFGHAVDPNWRLDGCEHGKAWDEDCALCPAEETS